MTAVNAHLWATRPWNTTPGRLVWWAKRYQQTRTRDAERGLRIFWAMTCQEIGEVAARAALNQAGVPIPVSLVVKSQKSPQKPVQKPGRLPRESDLPLFGFVTSARRIELRRAA